MKTRILLLTFLLLTSIAGFCDTVQIINNGFTFSPSSITIALGDNVNFTLAGEHNAVEVSQATWNSNGNTPLSGGFSVGFGGGLVSASELTVGIHYYVCQPHASMGMKGTITVSSLGLQENQSIASIIIFPNPATNLITIKSSESIMDLAYAIIDQSGRQVLTGRLNDTTKAVDISQLTLGVYFFQIGEERRQTFKIIKQ